jgi:hypothetical protein
MVSQSKFSNKPEDNEIEIEYDSLLEINFNITKIKYPEFFHKNADQSVSVRLPRTMSNDDACKVQGITGGLFEFLRELPFCADICDTDLRTLLVDYVYHKVKIGEY